MKLSIELQIGNVKNTKTSSSPNGPKSLYRLTLMSKRLDIYYVLTQVDGADYALRKRLCWPASVRRKDLPSSLKTVSFGNRIFPLIVGFVILCMKQLYV